VQSRLKTVVLIGGKGFIGGLLKERFEYLGFQVHALHRTGSHQRILEKAEAVDLILNLASTSTGSAEKITQDNLQAASQAILLTKQVKQFNPHVIFMHFGSITEYSLHAPYSHYSEAKKKVRQLIYNSGVCDFHCVFGFTFGGNPRMIRDFLKYRRLFSLFPSLLGGFQVAALHVETLISKISDFLVDEMRKNIDRSPGPPIEIRIPGNRMTLGELIQSVLISNKGNTLPNASSIRVPSLIEKPALIFLSKFFALCSKGDPVKSRISFFFRLAACRDDQTKQKELNHYLSIFPPQERKLSLREEIYL